MMPGRRKAHEKMILCKIRFICAQNGQRFDLLVNIGALASR
jgi:hypothetical protein